jgi:hypothetical protein
MEWSYIKGYELLYKISKDGTIISLPKPHKNCSKKEKLLSYRFDKDGYKRVTLCKDGICKTFGVHRLVADTYIPNPLNKETVNHRNAIKDDNRIENLEWATRSEQTKHLLKLGLRDMTYLSKLSFRGKHHSAESKLKMTGRIKKIK